MLLKNSRIVVTPGEKQPYKVVLERETKGVSEHPVSTMREGEALIRDNEPTRPSPCPDPWNGGRGNSAEELSESEEVD